MRKKIRFKDPHAYAYEIWGDDCYGFLKKWKPPREPKFIVDAGADVGVFSAMAAHHYPECRIFSFEAEEHIFNFFKRNMSLQKIVVNNKKKVYDSSNIMGYNRAFSLSDLFEEQQIDFIDFMKMDIEGSEYEILLHAEQMGLLPRVYTLSMELRKESSPEYKKLISILKSNYKIFEQRGSLIFCSSPANARALVEAWMLGPRSSTSGILST